MADGVHRDKRAKYEDSKAKKEVCRICYTELDGAYLTPCLTCRKPYCNDCIKKQFEMALKDREDMPPRCCRRVFYHNVARGILSPADLEIYKQRYDESITTNPFYCPKPTCSAFIPPRNLKPVHGKITCSICNTVSCIKCKQIADTVTHSCAKSTEADEITKQLGYKRCPKCNTGAMKMYGCPHIRCNNCGAHFCWDCLRPINVCNVKPCAQARDEGDMSEPDEGDSLSEDDGQSMQNVPVDSTPVGVPQRASLSESNLIQYPVTIPGSERAAASDSNLIQPLAESPVQSPSSAIPVTFPGYNTNTTVPISDLLTNSEPAAASTTSNPTVPTPATSTITEPTQPPAPTIPNLDDPHRADVDWENPHEFNFGEEPTDENWDIWGCLHRFNILISRAIPEKWLVGLDKSKTIKVECMGCFRDMKIEPQKRLDTAKDKDKENVAPDTVANDDVGPSESQGTADASIPNNTEDGNADDIVIGKKISKEDKKKAVYDCTDCGVIFCFWCRRMALRRVEKYRKETGQETARTQGE